ncbi:MAG TPA: hypothetical protein DEA96_01550 [Leptospiraceae bacterium]|nr:hypothetical protein [Spirochaetaceae bacterium]HBS03618.1 hypothetical protein [Leptospiraceae bacterium]|tara:strand:+ start:20120 stop:22357 length:2238 start_codon:yes stop_codon:yes gene_type:complete
MARLRKYINADNQYVRRIHLLIWLILFSFLPHCNTRSAVPEEGTVTIPTADVYGLSGSWLFFPEDLPQEAVLHSGPAIRKALSIRIPLSWHQAGLEIQGSAWYRLNVDILNPALLELREKREGLSLLLPHTDAAVEVYWNGKLVGRNGKIGPDGKLLESGHRTAVHDIPLEFVEPGRNVITIRNASYYGVGGFLTSGVFLGPQKEIHALFERNVIWNSVLGLIFVVVGIQHIGLFLLYRRALSYLYFGLFSASFGLIVLSLHTLISFWYENYLIEHQILFQSLIWIAIFHLQYLKKFYRFRIRIPTALIIAFCSVVSLFGLTSLFWEEGLYYTEKYIIPATLVSHILGIVWGTMVSMRALRKGIREARIIVIGYVIFGITTLLDILGYLNLFSMVGLTEEGFMAFVFCMGIALSSAFSTAHLQKEKLVTRLRANISKLMQTQQGLEFSEEKYRQLVENSAELIFTLTPSGEIITMNRQSQTHLGRSPRKLVGKNIAELAAHEPIGTVLLRDKIDEVIRSRSIVAFSFDFKNILGEPRQMNVVLQFIPDTRGNSDGTIYGRASAYVEDSLGQYLFSEKQTYFLANYITLGDQMSLRLTQHLHHFLTGEQIMSMQLGLREMIINAMEHGNLNITYEEKSAATREGTYIDLFRQRQAEAQFSEKKVKVDYILTPSFVGFRITDEGRGFDHSEMMRKGASQANTERLGHGRGIQIARSEFDSVRYNKKGNQVTLIKKFELIREMNPIKN